MSVSQGLAAGRLLGQAEALSRDKRRARIPYQTSDEGMLSYASLGRGLLHSHQGLSHPPLSCGSVLGHFCHHLAHIGLWGECWQHWKAQELWAERFEVVNRTSVFF